MAMVQTTAATITSLPDLCLLKIFDYLPITELLNLHLICSRFGRLKLSACSRRQTLQLVINRRIDAEPANFFERTFFEHPCQEELDGGPPLKKLDEYLQYPILNSQTVEELITLFSNIKYLKLAIKIDYQHHQLTKKTDTNNLNHLLTCWSPKLLSFNLSSHYDFTFHWNNLLDHHSVNFEINCQLLSIIETINSMPKLKALALVFSNYFSCDFDQSIDLPILANLEEFCFFSYDNPKMLLQSLRKYALPNPKLQRLAINSEPYMHRKDYSVEFQLLEPKLSQKFTRISRVWFPFIAENFFTSFSNLTSLIIEQNFELLQHLSIVRLASKLSPLHQLLHLKIHLITTQNRTLSVDDHISPSEIARLSSIKILQLLFSGSAHFDVHSAHFGAIFPNLVILRVQYAHWQCLPCRYDLRHNSSLKTQLKCYLKAVTPWWEQCAQLKKLYVFPWCTGVYQELNPKKEKSNTIKKFKKFCSNFL